MNESDGDVLARRLHGLASDAPDDFALRVARHVNIPAHRYDTYVRRRTAAGELFVASGPEAVTGAALAVDGLGPTEFEELHLARTGRSALPGDRPFPGLVTALRTGRAHRLALDLTGLSAAQQAVLHAVRTVPAGQLRPLRWIAHEVDPAEPPPAPFVLGALAANPVAVLIPTHRITYDNGLPTEAVHPPDAADALRRAEGIDMERVTELSRAGTVFLGSDTTFIYCHPTCAHARRITPRHRVPFPSARLAREAGFRACKNCRPLAA
ncbi:MGMT family protein [Streptomyces sp. P6-2-1]|uniref:MGMT family protein n=1 Tax=unclassified Streptomyces TaxID=2593676 RepID=UPI003D370128